MDDDYELPEPPPCETCNGSGTINPLTAPDDYFCVSTETCPSCGGDGLDII